METLAMIRQGEESMSRVRMFEWHVQTHGDKKKKKSLNR
jgi:hypothetical protein